MRPTKITPDIRKQRQCLGPCGQWFDSLGPGNRQCWACRKTNANIGGRTATISQRQTSNVRST